MSEQIFREKTDSISVSKTSTGKYSWDVKIYSNDLMVTGEQISVIEQIKNIHNRLLEQFNPDNVGGV